MPAKVRGFDKLNAKIQRMPEIARETLKDANNKNADEFMNTVERALGRGDPERGHLLDTLEKRWGQSDTGIVVSIGGPKAPYPLHLEGGHRAPNGEHVPAKPFWNPSKVVTRKRARARSSRALSKVVKAIVEG